MHLSLCQYTPALKHTESLKKVFHVYITRCYSTYRNFTDKGFLPQIHGVDLYLIYTYCKVVVDERYPREHIIDSLKDTWNIYLDILFVYYLSYCGRSGSESRALCYHVCASPISQSMTLVMLILSTRIRECLSLHISSDSSVYVWHRH